jgi:hypothetical protein
MTTSEEILLEGIKACCLTFSGGQKRWAILTQNGATDDDVLNQIREEFGIWGGRSMEWGWVEHNGGSTPHAKVDFRPDGEPEVSATIKGEKLIGLVRRVFSIPPKDGLLQLRLF